MALNITGDKLEKLGILESLYDSLDFIDSDVVFDEIDNLIFKLKRKNEAAKRKKLEEQKKKEAEEKEKQRLQHIESVTSMDLPLDWENVFDGDKRTEGVHAESIPDGLILSLSNLGKVDIEYISSITGEDYKAVICALKGSIFQNPDNWGECFYKGWETAEEYLSGNVIRKWNSAQEANKKYNGFFRDNVTALSKIIPPTVTSKDIYITLGSPWVPVEIIDEFISHLLDTSYPFRGTTHDEITGTWEIPNKCCYNRLVTSRNIYGTSRLEALHIIERTLNMKAITVTDEVVCLTNKSGKKRVINKSETLLAIEKQQKIIKEFQSWVWKDEQRKELLETIFENRFGCVQKRHFDGSFLNFPTLSSDIELYPYQKNAVARILFSPNTLLAHDVGSGKTYIMIAAGMELRRMGLSEKNLYVVPNNIIGQWKSIFEKMYPSAKLFCVEPKHFTPSKCNATLKKIRDGDFDGIIMAYSCFERIPLSNSSRVELLKSELDNITNLISNSKKSTQKLKNKADKIKNEIVVLECLSKSDDSDIYFDELGITRLFVDEAHNFKNVPIETKTDKVLGISASGSKKCKDMLDKVRHIQKANNGGGVVMATGTPITNSITDAFIMQSYLQSGELALLDLQNFDSWIGMFAERVTEFEIDVDTNSYRLATRFSKFHNLPELTSLLASIADFHQMDRESGVPDFSGYKDSLIAKTDEFSDYLDEISQRAEDVRSGAVRRNDDNMLKITTDGRKAALDIRLVNPSSGFTYQSKVARCAENVLDIYTKTAAQKSSQLIFCDSSTPKNGFNVYDEIKALLIRFGVPQDEIAFIHDVESEKSRNRLFEKIRKGEIRILLGSTFKLGLGVNIQDKLIAVHHLDVPWRPADMTQREGRILRQGNENKEINIYRYITEGSFDAYSWQLLETKQRFITGLLSGSLSERSGSDIENTVLNYAEVKALAIGNPLVKERVETANELSRYLTLQRKAIDNHIRLEQELRELPARIEHQKIIIEKCKDDAAFFAENKTEYDKEERKTIRENIFAAVSENVLIPSETFLMSYNGFDILLPANMSKEKPFVWLKRRHRYYVELGDTQVGGLIRIDNFLEKLEDYLEKLKTNLDELLRKESGIANELSKKEDYTDKIERLTKKLEKIDKKLGVDKK